MLEKKVEPERGLAKPLIALCVSDPGPRALVHQAAGLEKVQVSEVIVETDLQKLKNSMPLVFDLAPWNESALRALDSARRWAPFCPVLLYVPGWPGVSQLLARTDRDPLVRIQFQETHRHEVERLRRDIRILLRQVAAAVTTHLVEIVTGDKITEARVAYVAEVARWLAEPPVSSRPNVGRVAARLGKSQRSLQRAWGDDPLPRPKELLDWLTLLFLALAPRTTGLGKGAISSSIEMSRQAVYRLHKKLVRSTGIAEIPSPRDDFACALLACIARHAVPVSTLRSALGGSCAWLALPPA